MTEVHGSWQAGTDALVELFREGLPPEQDAGAALSIWHKGAEIVNVWAGTADPRSGRAWTQDTPSVIFSCSKGLTAIVLWRLSEQGLLDLEQPLARYWPEFGVHGKDSISVADVFAHRAGLSAPTDDLTLDQVLDRRWLAEYLAAQEPLWAPGTAHAYHAITFGTLAQELVRRVTGRELEDVFDEEIAQPIAADVSLKAGSALLSRRAYITTTPDWQAAVPAGTPTDNEWLARALTLGGAFPRPLVAGSEGFNDSRVVAAGVAGAGGVGTASALARVWSATVTRTRGSLLVQPATIASMTRERSQGPWHFDPGPPYGRFAVGAQLASAATPWLSERSFGHDGAGGQSGFADPIYEVGFGYLTNRMDVPDRAAPIIAELKSLLSGT